LTPNPADYWNCQEQGRETGGGSQEGTRMTERGLALELTGKGTKYFKDGDLNK
jgi:hypothetical protein